jgi:hypothetical protein
MFLLVRGQSLATRNVKLTRTLEGVNLEDKVNLYAIAELAPNWQDEPFDHSKLPAAIVPNVAIENIEPMFNPNTFDLFDKYLGKDDLEALRSVRHAIVHRFQMGNYHDEATQKLESGQMVYDLAACLRLIRPMRQFAMLIRGTLKPDGKLEVGGFDHPMHLMNIPLIQRGFTLRNRDVEVFQKVAGKFLTAIAGEYWKFRMPLSIHEPAHFTDRFWKARMSLLCSAIEAIFTSQTRDRDDSGSKVAKARIKWFLGENTSIYAPGDVPSFAPQHEPTIGEVLDDLYEVRNCLAHGDKVPDRFFLQIMTNLGESNRQYNGFGRGS